MIRPQDKHWLDKAIEKTAPGFTPEPDFKTWQQQHPQALASLHQRACQTAPSHVDLSAVIELGRRIMKSPITKLAIAAVLITGCLFLARHLKGGDTSPAPKPNMVKIVDPVPSQDNPPETRQLNELALAQDLYEQRDLPGLLTLLEAGQALTQIKIAGFLTEIGDASAIPVLQRLADLWEGQGDNPFTGAINGIETRTNQDAEDTVEESAAAPLLPIPEASQTITYQGLVQDDSGLPLANVKVWGQGMVVGDMQFKAMDEEGVTDQQGRFVLTVDHSKYKDHMALFLYFDHSDFGLSMLQMSPGKDQDLDVTLYPSERVAGTIVNSAGDPVAGAQVEASVLIESEQEEGRQMLFWAMNHMAVYTDAQGIFVLDRLPLPSRIQLRIHAQGYASYKTGEYADNETLYAIKAGDHDVKITLVPGTSVAGRIVFGDGSPYTLGAVLSIGSVERFIEVDTSGHFVIEDLPNGEHRISISDFKGKELCADVTIEIDPFQAVNDLVVIVQETIPVTIHLSNSESGKPAAHTKVHACSGEDLGTTVDSGRTDSGGHCELNLYPGDYQIKTEGWKNGNVFFFNEPLTVSRDLPMDTIHIDVPIRPMIKGQLVDTQGNPVQGFVRHYVELEPTDPNGFFEMPEPTGTPQTPHFISTYNLTREQGNHFFFRKGDLDGDWVVTVEPLSSLSGRFVDTEGRPVTDVTPLLVARTEGLGHQRSLDVQIDAKGRFVCGDIPYAVRLSLEAGPGVHWGRVDIDPLASGQHHDVGDIVVYALYDARESPALFLIDRAGNVRISPPLDTLEAWIKQFLAE